MSQPYRRSVITDEISQDLDRAIAVAVRFGLQGQNEPSCMVGTAAELAPLIDEIDSPSIRALWDPANAATVGERAYPVGFQEIIGHTPHIHLNDGQHVHGAWQHSVVGDGDVGLVDVSRALAEVGYSGWVALETHYRPSRTEADLRLPGGEVFSELGEAGTIACLEGWQRVLHAAAGALKR